MWKSHLLIALRSLARHRLFTLLNGVGLAIGMAACTLIVQWVGHERSHDRWIPGSERVFVVQSRIQYPGQEPQLWRHSPGPMLPLLQQDFAQVEAATRVQFARRALRLGARVESQLLLLADPGFFAVLPWPVLEGSTAQALARPGQVVVTEAFTRKWFGKQSALGQSVTLTVKGIGRSFQIVAVLRDPPTNSLFEFEAVTLLDPNDLPDPNAVTHWGSFSPLAVVRLRDAADAGALAAGADAFIAKHVPNYVDVSRGFFYRPELRRITDAHLQAVNVAGPGRPPGDARLVAAVAATGLLVLVIATITYVNLATARVSLRAREVGLRKTLGATQWQLIQQFLIESTVLASVAGVVALAIVELALPAFNGLLGQTLSLQYLGTEGVLLPLGVMVAAVGIVGGWYPAVVLARLRPRQALSGQQGTAGSGRLRQMLVVGQFSIAVALMCCMAVIYSQVAYLRSADMGYQPQGLAIIQQLVRTEVKPHQQALLDAVLRVPGVVAASRSMFEPAGPGISRQPAYLSGVPDSEAPQLSTQAIDWDYVRTYGARILAGRDLSRDFGGDNTNGLSEAEIQSRGFNVLINRAALKLFKASDPQAAIGKTFQLGGDGARVTATVVGVVDDIRIRSARDEALPSFFARDEDHMTSISVRFEGVPPAILMDRLREAWQQLFPDSPFAATLADDAIAGYYQAEQRSGHLFALFATVAIVLCAVGMYGLAIFTAERRTREIGLRKLLGARVGDIVRLLVWQFSKPVLVAMLIAWPVAWWLMQQWLAGFDLRVRLTTVPFVAAGLLALGIAWATIASHAIVVGRSRPIDALRQE